MKGKIIGVMRDLRGPEIPKFCNGCLRWSGFDLAVRACGPTAGCSETSAYGGFCSSKARERQRYARRAVAFDLATSAGACAEERTAISVRRDPSRAGA